MAEPLAPQVEAPAAEVSAAAMPDISVDEAQLMQAKALQQEVLAKQQNVVSRASKLVDDAVRSVASGATFGFADEFAATMDSLIKNRGFSEELAMQRARDKMIDPTVRMLGEITGGVLTGAVTGGLISPATTGVARMAKFAALGATEGALAGFGHAEGDVVDRTYAAGQGAVIGGVVGAAAPPLMDAFVRGFRSILGHPSTTSEQRKAVIAVAKALQRDEITPDRALAKLKQLGPEAVVADLPGENVLGTARAAAAVPGPARNIANRVLTERAVTAGDRARAAVAASMSDESALATRNGLIVARANKARPLYEEAFEHGVVQNEDALHLIATSKDVQNAIRQARRFPEYTDLPDNHIILLDKAYKNIGGKFEVARRAGDKPLANDLNNVRIALGDAIGHEVPAYRAAVQTFSSESDLVAAHDLGRQFITEDSEILKETVKAMTQGEHEQFIVGVARAIRERIDASPDTAAVVKRIFGNEAIRERLKLAFPSMSDMRDFQKTMLQEATFSRTAAKVLGGSPTAPRQTEIADFLGESALALRGDFSGILFSLARRARHRADSTKEMGKALFTADPRANTEFLSRLEEFQLRQSLVRPLSGGLTGGAVTEGAQFGRE